MSAVELVHVEKRFGEALIVRDLSLAVDPGAFLVLVGPSGCGKTTTLRMIAGLEAPTGGDVRIGGRRVNDVAPKDRDVAMVFQSYALYPHMSVRDNLAFGLTLRKLARTVIDQRVAEAARILGIGNLLERRPKQLSGGQRQRVAIGRAIVRDPKVFLFDEPLSNLDAALRVQMRAELATLHRRLGATMVYVTHDQIEAMMLATQVAVLDRGDLQQLGAPLELYHRPVNRFVAGFIGSPAMNFIDGAVEGQYFVAPGGVKVPVPGLAPSPKATLGVRPHDVQVGPHGLPVQAVAVEPMGWEAYAHVEGPAGRMVIRLEGRQAAEVRVGDTRRAVIPHDRIHVFDGEGRALQHPATPHEVVNARGE
ncbi:MAG: ABC transporter ATP-binding protein [Deltaproteobacteria bacterium]|nr:ABC transporter ATP-binding protein [Deltaproteobacteria bacterium]